MKIVLLRLAMIIILLGVTADFGYSAEFVEPGTENASNASAAPAVNESQDVDAFDAFDEFQAEAPEEIFDPLSGYNRFMTVFNDHLYVLLIRPVTALYRFVVFEPVRLAIGRMFANISYPVRCVNNLLQMKTKRAGIETARFFVNTTLGLAGLFDPAKKWLGLNAYPEDFGQTLGFYGVGSGFPVVLPVMGPSNLRDIFGYGPDYFLQPMTYVDDIKISVSAGAAERLNTMSLYLDTYDALRAEAIDLYIFQRDAYEMRRNKLIEE